MDATDRENRGLSRNSQRRLEQKPHPTRRELQSFQYSSQPRNIAQSPGCLGAAGVAIGVGLPILAENGLPLQNSNVHG